MSSENYVGIIMAENLRFLGERSVRGEVAAGAAVDFIRVRMPE